MTTHIGTSSGYGCGGHSVIIEINLENNETCLTYINAVTGFYGGHTLTWYGTKLGNCGLVEFDKNATMITFKVKSTSYDNFCPKELTITMENDITEFKSLEMNHLVNKNYWTVWNANRSS